MLVRVDRKYFKNAHNLGKLFGSNSTNARSLGNAFRESIMSNIAY